MKPFLPVLSLAILFTACTTTPDDAGTKTLQSAQPAQGIDTAGLSAFQQWKAQNELTVAPPPQQVQTQVDQAPVKTVTIIREVRVPQPEPARTTVRRKAPTPVEERPAPMPQEQPELPAPSGSGDVASNSGDGNSKADAPVPGAETAKKEGMSNATKGAVIGSAGGAVIGAVLNKKNRGVGAVIGGVVGGAVGYGLGKKKDKKETP